MNTVEKITEKWLQARLITLQPSVLQSVQSPTGTGPEGAEDPPDASSGPGGTSWYHMCRLVSSLMRLTSPFSLRDTIKAPGLCTVVKFVPDL